MASSPSSTPEVAPDSRVAPDGREETGSASEASGSEAEFFVVTHDVLFESSESNLCDACGVALADPSTDTLDFHAGRGAYVRGHGGEIRIETVPLCAACASAIGLTALARWEIEEEEG